MTEFSKRFEVESLKDIQKELTDYNFFRQISDIKNTLGPLVESETSGISFSTLPDLPLTNNFLKSTIHTNALTHFHVINIGPKDQSDIHLDVDDSPWALNIPIKNCEYSSTIWYDKAYNELERIRLDTVYLIKVDQYHQIVNHCDSNRLVLTMRFTGTYNLLDIIK